MQNSELYPHECVDPALRQTLIDALRKPPEDASARECGLACSPAFPVMQAALKDLRARLADTPSADAIAQAEDDAADARAEYHELHEAAELAIRAARRAKNEAERLDGAAKKLRMSRGGLFSRAVGQWQRWQNLMQETLGPELEQLGFDRNGNQAFRDVASQPPTERAEHEPTIEPELATLPSGRPYRHCPTCRVEGEEIGRGGDGSRVILRCRACRHTFSFDAADEHRALTSF